jgi:DNA-binding response OmpR family regulator/Tfp pilus assembly protein PilZ
MMPRILVVEDELLLRQMMRDTLEPLPAGVIEAKDGEEALRLAAAEQPDLIICDVIMPGLTGYDVAVALKDDPRTAEIPLIFLSALGTSDHKVRGLELGADDFLTKPVDPKELMARVKAILRRATPLLPEAPASSAVASGNLQAMSLATLARSLELERRNARLVLTREREVGAIVFVNGRISRAFQGARRGDAAVYHLLTWEEGSFDMLPFVESAVPAGGEVKASNEALLQEGARRREEIAGLLVGLPGSEAMMEIPEALRALLQEQVSTEEAMLATLLDGTRPLEQVIAGSPFDAWTTLKVLDRLLRMGALGWTIAQSAGQPAAGPAGQPGTARRSLPRLTVDGPIQYQSLPAFRQAARFTLTTRGVFIHTATPFDMGEKVLIRFQIPGEATWVTAVGQVTWRNADVQKSKQAELGMSVHVVEAPKEYLEAIGKRLTQSVATAIHEIVEPS